MIDISKILEYVSYLVGTITLISLISTAPVHFGFLAGAAALYFVAKKVI